MGSGASTGAAAEEISKASPEELKTWLGGLNADDKAKITAALNPASAPGLIDISGLTRVAINDDGLSDQPAEPKYKLALIECYNDNHPTGGSDKMLNKHRFDTIPIANGLIKQGMSCQIIHYVHTEHDKFMEVVSKFDAVVVRCNPGHIDGAGGSQNKFDADMQELAKRIPVWPTAGVMTKMGAKDALVKIKDKAFGLTDTEGYYSPEDMKTKFPKTIKFQPRVVKQNRGSAGEGIWIIKLKSGEYCKTFEEEAASPDDVLILEEANDKHVEEHTVAEFIEFCVNGRTDTSGTWTTIGTGKYFEGGAEAGGQMVDQRYLPSIDEKGEARFFMLGSNLYNIEHYLYIGGVSGETTTTIYPPDAERYADTKKMLETEIASYMTSLGLGMEELPLLWAADFMEVEGHVVDGQQIPLVIGEFNCSCLGIGGYLDARGKDNYDSCKPEDAERGAKMCDHIGEVAFKALEERKK